MLMNDKIIFDHYFCIKEMTVHFILQPHHVIPAKVFILILGPGGLQYSLHV